MEIKLNNAGKKYLREWIFRKVDLTLAKGSKWVILGPNGSGKSTLLQVLSSAVALNEGTVDFYLDDKQIEIEEVYKNISLAAPYLELIEEFTLQEIISFHFKFKKIVHGLSEKDVIQISGLEKEANKVIRFFSSGMKQRLKLTLAILSDTSLLLLDEPCSNLDSNVIEWYQKMIRDYAMTRTIIVASNNQTEEFFFCDNKISIDHFK